MENAGLTEWPVPLLGRFDAAFLDVPPEVIQLTARVNQKYFVCKSSQSQDGEGDHAKHGGGVSSSVTGRLPLHQPAAEPLPKTSWGGSLANAFVCTANIDARGPGRGGGRQPQGPRRAAYRCAVLLGAGPEEELEASCEEAGADYLPREAGHRGRQGRAGGQAGALAVRRGDCHILPIADGEGDRRSRWRGIFLLCQHITPPPACGWSPPQESLGRIGRGWPIWLTKPRGCARPIWSPKWSANSPNCRG